MDALGVLAERLTPGVGEFLGHDVLDLGVFEVSRFLMPVGTLDGLQHGHAIMAFVEVELDEVARKPSRVGEASAHQILEEVFNRLLAQLGIRLDEQAGVPPRTLSADEPTEMKPASCRSEDARSESVIWPA